MKKIISLCVFVLAFTSGSAFAKTTPKTESEMDPKKKEMMENLKKYGTPGENHKVFQKMVGKWRYTSKFWETAEGTPEVSDGTSTIKLILGDRFLQHEVKGTAMGKPFQGLGITGYDNVKGQYDTTWLDNMATGVMHGTGSYEASTQTLKDSGTHSCPMTGNKEVDFRSEWKIVDKNTMLFTMWGPNDEGDEIKRMEITYSRVKVVSQN